MEPQSRSGVQSDVNIRWRIGLPLGHLIIDCIILCAWLWHAQSSYNTKVFRPGTEQEGQVITFDPISLPPASEFLMIASGTMPTALVSDLIRPHGYLSTPERPLDPYWFPIHEAVSFPLWFLIGLSVEYAFFRIKKSLITYLAARLAFACLLIGHRAADLAWRIQTIAWLIFGLYFIAFCLRWVYSKLRSSQAKAG